jgi:diguanylate cyclase (GGDEF)-like protein
VHIVAGGAGPNAGERYTARMRRRRHLRTRVLLLTGAFTLALFAIAFGLSWRAKQVQQRWTRLLSVETEAVAALEDFMRAQSAFLAQYEAGMAGPERYVLVVQVLTDESLAGVDLSAVRARMKAFRDVISEPSPRPVDVRATSAAVIGEAQQIVEVRKREIAGQLPRLERETGDMMTSGLAVAWIVALLGFAAVQATLRKVVTPIEELSSAANRIGSGDLTARAPVTGDHEIATLGVALNRMADELKARARTDELTGLPNFRAFRERFDEELARADRYPASIGVLVLDLDRFKNYNDTYGHPAGNEALRRVAQTIRETVRSVDFPARYGGEEFAVIVPQADAEAMAVVAERVRAGVEALPAPAGGAKVTVSIGGAMFPADGSGREALFQKADERLYQAKEGGRNRVVTGFPLPAVRSNAPRSA